MPFRVRRLTKYLVVMFILQHEASIPVADDHAEIGRIRSFHKQSGQRRDNPILRRSRTAFPEDCLTSCLDWPHCLGVNIMINDTEEYSTECELLQEISEGEPVVYIIQIKTWISFVISGMLKYWVFCDVYSESAL